MIDRHLIHCVGGCKRGRYRDLQVDSKFICDNCGSNKIAVWQGGNCLYAYSGKVEYPFGSKMKVGDPVTHG